MGDTASNLGGPWLHSDPSGNVLDVHLGGWHYAPTTGTNWVKPSPVSVSVYAGIYSAAVESAAAFEAALDGTPWEAFYTGLSTEDRATLRRLVKARPPVSTLPA